MPDDPEMLVKLLDLQLAQARLQRERHEKGRSGRRAAAVFVLIVFFAVIAAGLFYLSSIRGERQGSPDGQEVHASSR